MDGHRNRIRLGDCVAGMNALPAGSVDLAFADPPFNIGYEYDVYDDRKETEQYLAWSRDWIAAVHRALKPTGTFWLAIGDEYAAELTVLSQQLGFHCRSWVVWYYTFGVNCARKFSRSHAHLFHFVKDPRAFTFRCDEIENRIPSARQLVYADARANPFGRLPDDTWILRPQDLADRFTPQEDTWYFPRVAGTFRERAGFHGCQMPEQLLGRIIRLCSEPGELVLDPFSGSATTLAVAKKLGRSYIGFDVSKEYVERGWARLAGIAIGDPLDGAAEPTASAPPTPEGAVDAIRKGQKSKGKQIAEPARRGQPKVEVANTAPERLAESIHARLLEAFETAREGHSLDRLVADPALNERLCDECRRIGLPGDARTWNRTLFALRKAGALAQTVTERVTEFSWQHCDPFLFASEIALRQMHDEGFRGLDEVLCDPAAAREFDERAARLAPGFMPLEYRWGALKLRKEAKTARSRSERLAPVLFRRAMPLDEAACDSLPAASGLYLLSGRDGEEPLYVGEALDLRARFAAKFGQAGQREQWQAWAPEIELRLFPVDGTPTELLAYQYLTLRAHQSRLNLRDLSA